MSEGLLTQSRAKDAIPSDLYVHLVQALFADKKALILGSACTAACGIVTLVVTQSWFVAAIVLAMVCVAMMRLADFSRFGALGGHLRLSCARRWELRYTIGAASYMALLGVWTLFVFLSTDDTFPRLLALSATLGHALGIATRNFSFIRGTDAQIVAALVPLSLTCFFAGGRYIALLPLVLLPIFIFIKGSAARLRATFLDATLLAREKTVLAERFDTALNNMSHGLCMLDREGRIAIVNEKLLQLLGIRRSELPLQLTFAAALRDIVARGGLSAAHAVKLRRLVRDGADGPPVLVDYRNGRAGEITVRRMEGGGSIIVAQDVTERRESEQIIDRMAHVDPVTDLSNRRSFEEKLALSLRAYQDRMQRAAIFFLDLDDFKQVNDSLGHASGDALLRIVAERLKNILRPADHVARWGGDEFAILFPDARPDQIPQLADRIIEEISRPCTLADTDHVVGVSIGVASIPEDGLEAKTLLSKADIALYAAKAEGRSKWRAFESEMEEVVVRRRLLEMSLRTAVATDAIDVFYQPIMLVGTGQIAGFEALARWQHPSRGFISPAEFIPLVEELDLMEKMGANILRKACAFCLTLPPDMRISVNLSTTQFWKGDIVQTVKHCLEETGLQGSRLDLEITESILLDDRASTRAAIVALRELGVSISLDDFGTGYSGLAYLLKVPLDRIKLDQAFTRRLAAEEPARILVEGIADICKRLDIDVLIEGVETQDEFQRIKTFAGIIEAQGYLFSRPIPARDVPALLESAALGLAA